MRTLYLYVPNNIVDNCIKYGIKLSEYANKVINIENSEKKGIIAFLSPKDSELYDNADYICLKINTKNLNIFIYNNTIFEITKDKKFLYDIKNYKNGNFEEPIAFIASSILPENISIYNKNIDIPLIIENSKEFYYKKSIYDMLEDDLFSSFEIYQLLLILGQKKNIFSSEQITDKLKLYTNKKTSANYTKKSNF